MGISEAWKVLVARDKPEGMMREYQEASTLAQDLAQSRYALRQDQVELVNRAVGEVWIAAEYNAKTLASVPIRLYKRDRGKDVGKTRRKWLERGIHGKAAQYAHRTSNIVEVEDHEALALLANPNQPETGVEFMRIHWLLAQLTGQMYWLHNATKTQPPYILNKLYPQWTKIDIDPDGIVSYSYGRNRAEVRTFPAEAVVQFKYFPSPISPWYGEGWLRAIAPECDSLVAAVQTSLNRWNNEGRPDFAVSTPVGAGSEVIDRIKEMFRRFRGPFGAGQSVVIGPELKVQPLQWPAKDVQYLDEKKDLRETIWRAAGIPSQLMQGNASGSMNHSGQQQAVARGQYFEDNIIPHLCAFCERLNESYLPLFGVAPGEMWFAPDNPMGEDQKYVEEATRLDVAAGIITANEAREKRQLEPVEGGDELRYQGTALDETADEADPANGPETPDDNPDDVPVKFLRKKKVNAKTVYTRLMTVAGVGHLDCGCKHTKDAGEAEEPSPYDAVSGQEAELERLMREYYLSIEATARGSELRYDQKKERDRLRDIVLVLLLSIYREGYNNGTARVVHAGVTVDIPSFTNEGEAARAFVDEYVPKMTQSVTSTIRDQLKGAIADAVEAGATPEEVQAALDLKLQELAKYGPQRVASTETVRTFNAGTEIAWKQAKIVKKRWHTARDEQVCPFCYQMDGVEATIGEPFYKQGQSETISDQTIVFDYSDVDGPPLHASCRCWLDFVVEGE